MAFDDVLFLVIQNEIPFGVMQGEIRMSEAMKAVSFVGLMPIIEIIIMEQSPSYQGGIVEIQSFVFGVDVASDGHVKRMVIDREIAMGNEGFQLFVFFIFEDGFSYRVEVFIDYHGPYFIAIFEKTYTLFAIMSNFPLRLVFFFLAPSLSKGCCLTAKRILCIAKAKWVCYEIIMPLLNHPLSHFDKSKANLKNTDRTLNTIGFAIYDILHIFCAIVFLILAIEGRDVTLDSGELNANLALEVADEFTELIISFVLIFFVIFIYRSQTEKTQMVYYTFAWLIVSMSLLIPATFDIPSLYIYNHGAIYSTCVYVLRNFNLYLPLAGFLLFLLALLFAHEPKKWRIVLDLGIAMVICFSITSTAVYVSEQLHEGTYFAHPLQTILRHIFLLAPLIPSFLTLFSLRYAKKDYDIEESSEATEK